MEFIKGIENFRIETDTSITIGNFDGIHVGHARIIEKTVLLALKHSLKSVVITFDPHPGHFFGHDLKLLMDIDKKNEILASYGVDYHVAMNFNRELMSMDPEVFVRELLCKKLHSKFIVVGYDYRFGARRKGDYELLRMLSSKYGYQVFKVDKVMIEGMTVSSSNIRKLLLSGEVNTANRMLGRYYLLDGVVEKGDGLGKLLSFPTANIKTGDLLIPKHGVYATFLKIDNLVLKSVTNVGIRPTIPGVNQVRIETHILDYGDDLYGKKVEVQFVDYIREEKKFDNFELLKNAIANDCEIARKILEKI